MRAGADRNAPTDRGKWTPLHLACWYTSVECVIELLKWGANMGPTERPVAGMGARGASLDRVNEKQSTWDGARRDAFAVEEQEEEAQNGGDAENGYGKTPAEVIGLKHLAAAANSLAANGVSGPNADPGLDEEEEQMVVLGDDGEKSPTRTQAPIHLFHHLVLPEKVASRAALSGGSLPLHETCVRVRHSMRESLLLECALSVAVDAW